MLPKTDSRVIMALKAIKGIDFALIRYQDAGSFKKALKVYFESFHQDLTEALNTHEVVVTSSTKQKKSKSQTINEIANFYVEISTVLNQYILDLAKILSVYNKKIKTVEQKEKSEKDMQEFLPRIAPSFATVRKKATHYLRLIDELKLRDDLDPTIVTALDFWKTITGLKFIRLVISGKKIPWIPADEQTK